MDWAKTTARGDEKHLSFDIWCDLYKRFFGWRCSIVVDVKRNVVLIDMVCMLCRWIGILLKIYVGPEWNYRRSHYLQFLTLLTYVHILQQPKCILVPFLIGLGVVMTMLSNIGVPYLWIWALCLVQTNAVCRLPNAIYGHYITSVYCEKKSVATTTKLLSMIRLIPKSP